MTLRQVLPLMLLVASPSLAQATEPNLLAGACQGCHGAGGQGVGGIPAIKDTHGRDEFVAIMRAFRANQREATVMGRIARGYTEEQIDLLAAHFARAQ